MPIRRKLTLVILFISGTALVLACTVLAAYEWMAARRAIARNATVLADVVGANSRAALAFDDEAAAREILGALSSEPDITAAELYRANGERFARYTRTGAQGDFSARSSGEGANFGPGGFMIVRPVFHLERRVGSIALIAELGRIERSLWMFVGVAAGVALLAFVVALSLSSSLQRPITGPILRLAEVAHVVAERRDYSVRAPLNAPGEVGILTAAFNSMLAGIETREAALNESNERLVRENAERVEAEARAQSQVLRLSQINQITQAIGERQDVQSIYQTVVANLEEQMPVDFAAVFLRDAERGVLKVTCLGPRGQGIAERMQVPLAGEVRVDANGLARCVSGELVYEPNLGVLSGAFPRRLFEGGLRAAVIAPLVVEAQVFGVLLCGRTAVDGFSSRDCEFIRQLSEHVALAAHQAQLYQALQRAYEELRQTQALVLQQERLRALGQMASGIAHDINNAVSPVSLYVESILEKEPALSAQSREWLQTVQRAIDDVAHTVARMREFYRQREPQLTLVPVPTNRLVEQVAELTRARWFDMPQHRGIVIDLRLDLAPSLPPIAGVESEIREALINLVFNAVDALPRGGRLTLRTRSLERARNGDQPEHRVAIEVIDAGVGMDEETRRRCIEPFFTTKGERGTGLGLAMVYGLARRHHAELEIESAPDCGTTVRLEFPVAPAHAAQLINDVPLRPKVRLRILIVDDDMLLVKSLREILEGDGHVVTVANGGQAGINAFRDRAEHRFDVVITDLGMPYVDGRKVAAAVKALSPQTPVFMLTGWGGRLQVEGDIPPEVDLVLSKPPKLRELREALAGVPAPVEGVSV